MRSNGIQILLLKASTLNIGTNLYRYVKWSVGLLIAHGLCVPFPECAHANIARSQSVYFIHVNKSAVRLQSCFFLQSSVLNKVKRLEFSVGILFNFIWHTHDLLRLVSEIEVWRQSVLQLTNRMGYIDTFDESFIPYESHASIYHNQGAVDSLSRSLINTNRGVF